MSEGPWPLPEGWRWVRLGEICTPVRKTIDPRRYPDRLFALYSIPAYDAARQPEIKAGSEVGSAKLRIEKGLCLFSKLNPRIPRVWLVDDGYNLERIASTEFLPLKPQLDAVYPRFLEVGLATDAFMKQLREQVSGATGSRQRLSPASVLAAWFPLPPLDEQKRIVARIEELMERIREARRLREQARADADRLWQSVLADTFPRPGDDLPAGWRWVRLGEVCRTRSGNSKRIKGRLHTEPAEGLFPGYSAAGQDVWLDHYEHEGDAIILSAVGARCGKCFLASGKWTAIANTHIIWPITSQVDIRYLWYMINDEKFWIRSQSAQPFVKVGESRNKLIPLPPLDEQKRIVARLDAVRERIDELTATQDRTAEALETLQRSILDRAFRGEL